MEDGKRLDYPLSSIFYLPSSIFHPPSSIFYLPSSIFHLPSSIFHPPSSIFYPLSSIFHPPSSILYPHQKLEPATRLELARDPHRGCRSSIELRGLVQAAGRTRTCIDEFRKLAPDPFGHGSVRWRLWVSNPSIGFAGPACRRQHLVPKSQSGSRGSNSDSPAPKAVRLPNKP